MEDIKDAIGKYNLCEDQKKFRPWSDIPKELLSLIGSHLYGGDYILFRKAVCKSWRSACFSRTIVPRPLPTPYTYQYPCLLFNNQIFDPIYSHIYTAITSQCEPDAYLRVSNYSWLLMSRESSLFFQNPFTNERMDISTLPDIDGFELFFSSLCFSAAPTSPDCMVFGLSRRGEENIAISLRKRGEDWKVLNFTNKKPFMPSDANPVFFKGSYYCLGEEGNLVIFNPQTKKCWWTARTKALGKKLQLLRCQSFLVEVEGELLVVHVAFNGTWLRVLRLKQPQLVWEPVDNLGNKMLYLSHPASFSATATVSGTSNKIYFAKFHDKSKSIFYSLSTGKFHSFDGHFSSTNLYGIRDYSRCTWIKPVQMVDKASDNKEFRSEQPIPW